MITRQNNIYHLNVCFNTLKNVKYYLLHLFNVFYPHFICFRLGKLLMIFTGLSCWVMEFPKAFSLLTHKFLFLFHGNSLGPAVSGQFEVYKFNVSAQNARLAELSWAFATLVRTLSCMRPNMSFKYLVAL